MEKQKKAFVICPIGAPATDARRHSDMVYNSVLKPVFHAASYELARSDLMSKPGIITNDIVNAIVNSDVCVADLTGLNANVFYELGIAHSAKRPTIHIASMDTKLPFDNLGYRAILFDPYDWHSQESARAGLSDSLAAIAHSTFKVSNPVTSAQAEFEIARSDDPQKQAMQDLLRRVADLERARSTKPGFDKMAAVANAAASPRKDLTQFFMSLATSADGEGYVHRALVDALAVDADYSSSNWTDDIAETLKRMKLQPIEALIEHLREWQDPDEASDDSSSDA